MADLGIFRAMVPIGAGGEECELPTWMRVVEELSTVDGSVGWVAGVGGSVNAVLSQRDVEDWPWAACTRDGTRGRRLLRRAHDGEDRPPHRDQARRPSHCAGAPCPG